jgi:hypothetical protein
VMAAHFIGLAVFPAQPEPPALFLREIVLDSERNDGTDAGCLRTFLVPNRHCPTTQLLFVTHDGTDPPKVFSSAAYNTSTGLPELSKASRSFEGSPLLVLRTRSNIECACMNHSSGLCRCRLELPMKSR